MKNSKRNQQRAQAAKPPPSERWKTQAPVSKYARKMRGIDQRELETIAKEYDQ